MFLLHTERGQGLAEYALILALVAIVVIIIVAVYGTQTANMFSQITNRLP